MMHSCCFLKMFEKNFHFKFAQVQEENQDVEPPLKGSVNVGGLGGFRDSRVLPEASLRRTVFEVDYACAQDCGFGSAWIRIHFPPWIRIQEGKFVH